MRGYENCSDKVPDNPTTRGKTTNAHIPLQEDKTCKFMVLKKRPTGFWIAYPTVPPGMT
jgi:hypothetical protein